MLFMIFYIFFRNVNNYKSYNIIEIGKRPIKLRKFWNNIITLVHLKTGLALIQTPQAEG